MLVVMNNYEFQLKYGVSLLVIHLRAYFMV